MFTRPHGPSLWLCLASLSCTTARAPHDPPGARSPSASSAEVEGATALKPPPGFRVPVIFGDHMLLQRDRENPIWGYDSPGGEVSVTIAGQTRAARAGTDGRWEVMLPALAAGGPHTLTVTGTGTRKFSDVVVGEVWLASGQSNMEFELAHASGAERAISGASEPGLRLFTVAKRTSGKPLDDVDGAWRVCTPESAEHFSAVAYFFGRKLHAELGVPVGLIHSSWGGTPAEAWTSRAALAARPETERLAAAYSANLTTDENAKYEKARAAWRERVYCKDPGNRGLALRYADVGYDDSRWKELEVPGVWQKQGLDVNGAVWFRRAFTTANPSGDYELELGAIDDFDETYVNGVKVGGIGPENPDAWKTPRRYRVPRSALRPGRNVVAVRVFDHFGDGGFRGAPAEIRIAPAGRAGEAASLAGPWRTLVEWSVPYPKELLGKEPQPPAGPNNQNSPGVLFDAMIAPLVPFGLRGAIWYQGESNVGRAKEYEALLPTLIADWRARFRSDLAFHIVQLANFLARSPTPADSAWAELRAAQAKTAATVPGAGLAVAIDIGDADDIHPTNKRDVGERLALVALAKTYGKGIEYSGPTLESARAERDRVRVTFSHADRGLRLAGGSKKALGFAIAGADRRFAWAEARLDGKSVVLSSTAVKEPRWVRYAWADNPEVNLTNGAGLPAVPFEAPVAPQ